MILDVLVFYCYFDVVTFAAFLGKELFAKDLQKTWLKKGWLTD